MCELLLVLLFSVLMDFTSSAIRISYQLKLLVLQTGTTIIDQMDLLREQVKMLAGEVALCTSSLKRLSEQVVNNPDDQQIQACELNELSIYVLNNQRTHSSALWSHLTVLLGI